MQFVVAEHHSPRQKYRQDTHKENVPRLFEKFDIPYQFHVRSHEDISKHFQRLIDVEEMGGFGIEIAGRIFSYLTNVPIECAAGLGVISGCLQVTSGIKMVFVSEESAQLKRMHSSEQNWKMCVQGLKSLIGDDLVMSGGVSSRALHRCKSRVPCELYKLTKRTRYMKERGQFCRASWRRSNQPPTL